MNRLWILAPVCLCGSLKPEKKSRTCEFPSRICFPAREDVVYEVDNAKPAKRPPDLAAEDKAPLNTATTDNLSPTYFRRIKFRVDDVCPKTPPTVVWIPPGDASVRWLRKKTIQSKSVLSKLGVYRPVLRGGYTLQQRVIKFPDVVRRK